MKSRENVVAVSFKKRTNDVRSFENRNILLETLATSMCVYSNLLRQNFLKVLASELCIVTDFSLAFANALGLGKTKTKDFDFKT